MYVGAISLIVWSRQSTEAKTQVDQYQTFSGALRSTPWKSPRYNPLSGRILRHPQSTTLSVIPPVSPTRQAQGTWKAIGLCGPRKFGDSQPRKKPTKAPRGLPSRLPIPNVCSSSTSSSSSSSSSAGARTPTGQPTLTLPVLGSEWMKSTYRYSQAPISSTKVVTESWKEDLEELSDGELQALGHLF